MTTSPNALTADDREFLVRLAAAHAWSITGYDHIKIIRAVAFGYGTYPVFEEPAAGIHRAAEADRFESVDLTQTPVV